MTDAGVLHVPDNKSDHSPVYCVIDREVLQPANQAVSAPHKPCPSWKKASVDQKEDYKNLLDNKLGQLVIPVSSIQCQDVT